MAPGPAEAYVRRRSDVAEPPACTACGGCCHSDDPRWIQVFGADEDRLTADERETLTVVAEDGARFMRFVARGSGAPRRCIALRVDATGARCGIYARRPDACRWLQRGSGLCRELIVLRHPCGDRAA
ncbi:MAG: YkgJ family cysteine cluster protein [Myxococcota bacterium]